MPELITLGETMVCFTPENNEPLQYAHTFEKRIAGAESNVAIAAARLGHSSGWISKLGNDPFGSYIKNTIRGEGVDVSGVRIHSQNPTGLMFKQICDSCESVITYYRQNSAASTLTPSDLNPEYFRGCRIFHTTGINSAISQSAHETVKAAIQTAKAAGCMVSFDPNVRLKLCTRQKIRGLLLEIIRYSDILLLGLDEAEILFDTREPEEIFLRVFGLGVRFIGLKMGDQGAYAADPETSFFCPTFPARKVDSIGAGDAFNAGFLTGLLEGRSLEDCGLYGSAMGAMAVMSKGDFENLPDRNGLESFLSGSLLITR
ncbi:sugar kinase [Diplocloster agilis]|uniref:Sugar kinase n=1 Tax=Diplocloster agilis TaxID=2850323 RepID=A0A949K1S6_9FIRM|nr:sugar kinase [Diplocloster agilis]MBU9737757.1 sugar kinase [Diplocloster agilis]